MASRIIGRLSCRGECGFENAHVKESEKCWYAYCPSCGCNGPHFRTQAQKDNIAKVMRPVDGAPTPTGKPAAAEPAPIEAAPAAPTPTVPTATPTPAPGSTPNPPTPPAPPRRRSSLFGL